MRAADQVIQNQQAALQMKMQETQLAATLREQEAMNAEFGTFNELQQGIADFLNSGGENVPLPKVPVFKSKTYQAEAMKAISGLDQYSERAKAMRAANNVMFQANRFDQQVMDDAAKFGAFKTDPESGMVMRGQNGLPMIDFNVLNAKRSEAMRLDRASKISSAANLGSEDAIRGLGLPQDLQQMAIDAMNAKKAAKSPLTAALYDWQNAPDSQKDSKFQVLKAAAAKSGQDVVINSSGEPEFQKALPQQVQTQLLNGIKSANTAIELIDSITDKEIDSSFGAIGGFNAIAQKIPMLPKAGLGLNKDQISISQKLGSLTPLVARSLLSEQGRLTDADARRAEDLIKTKFTSDSPEQVKQSLRELRGLFENAKERMKSPFGIVGQQEVMKVDVQPSATSSAQQEKVFEFDASGTFLK
jgi:hypothetical protein